MLERGKYPKKRTVMIINDYPVKSEIALEEKFSATSNLNLLTSLRTGRVANYNKQAVPGFKGILSTDIHTTYVDYSFFGEPELEKNFDYLKEFRKKKGLIEDVYEGFSTFNDEETNGIFRRLDHQKDCYISERLWYCLQGLLEEIRLVEPKIIVVTGKWALFLLTGCTTLTQTQGNAKDRKPLGGLTKFRASIMQPHSCWNLSETLLIPIYHPVNAMGMLDKVAIMELDIQKIGWMYHKIKEDGDLKYYIAPEREYILGTSKEVVITYLKDLLEKLDKAKLWVSADVETMFKSFIDCIGITTAKDGGLCIPFATIDNPNFWSLEDEIEIMLLVKQVLEHPNALQIGQNYAYDCQYYYKLWGISAKPYIDTMVLHHILYNYLPKDLAFLASLYCITYQYWKDEIEATKETPEQRWTYNIKDICYTLEVAEVLFEQLLKESSKLQELYWFQQEKVAPVLVDMMNRGVKIDKDRKEELYTFFHDLMGDITNKINEVLGFDFNQNSTPQKKKLFTEFFGMTLKKKKGGNETCDASAMLSYIEEYPLYRPFLTLLLEYASLKVFVNTFLGMRLDDDNRARTAYNIAGTATGRLASRKNVWGNGANLMNIPEKGKINLRYAVEVLEEAMEVSEDSLFNELEVEGSIALPNVKKIFLPDEGKELADADYSGADAMIVAWDSECKWLIDFFETKNEKLYAYIASMHLQREITSNSPEYKSYKAVMHGTNYGLGLDKLTNMLRIPYESAKELQEFYFNLCPEIKTWHNRIKTDISKKGYIENIFGRRGWFIDKNDPTLYNKAYAFIPQSSIADLMNHAMVNIAANPNIEILLQVHDSAVVQYPIEIAEQCRKDLKDAMEFYLPYEHPLKIPADMKVSRISYGDTEKIKKPEVRDYKIIENTQLSSFNA